MSSGAANIGVAGRGRNGGKAEQSEDGSAAVACGLLSWMRPALRLGLEGRKCLSLAASPNGCYVVHVLDNLRLLLLNTTSVIVCCSPPEPTPHPKWPASLALRLIRRYVHASGHLAIALASDERRHATSWRCRRLCVSGQRWSERCHPHSPQGRQRRAPACLMRSSLALCRRHTHS